MPSTQRIPKNPRPHILYIINTAKIGGGAQHLKVLLEASKTPVALICGETGPLVTDAQKIGVPCHVIPFMGNRFNLLYAAKLAQLVRKLRPEFVHVHGTRSAFLYAIARLFHPQLPRFIYTEHGFSHRQELSSLRLSIHRQAERFAIANCDELLCVAKCDVEHIKQQAWKDPKHIHYVPNSIDIERFKPDPNVRRHMRKELGLGPKQIALTVVSRFVPQKAVEDALRAICLARQSNPNLKAFIIGTGPLFKEIHQRFATQANLEFLGQRTDIEAVLNAMDIYILSSHWEGLPIGILEAMSCETSVIASDTEGAREAIQHKERGLLYPIGDITALSEAILQLAHNPALRKNLGTHARLYVSQHHTKPLQIQASMKLHPPYRGRC